MNKICGILLAFSLLGLFGIEPVEKDDISVYDPPEQKEKSIEASEIETLSNDESLTKKGKGYVLGTDELHVAETQSDTRGYTSGGYYGNKSQTGKGLVYASDELHVIGLPTDPNTGYTLPGFYGSIE